MSTSKSAPLILPLRCLAHPNPSLELKTKFALIAQTGVLNQQDLQTLVSGVNERDRLPEDLKAQILKLALKAKLNDFDLAEAFASYLGSIESKLPDSLIERVDPAPGYNKMIFKGDYPLAVREMFKVSTRNISKLAIPRIRAKLAVIEMVAIATRDESLIFYLVELSPRYLGCKLISELVNFHRMGLLTKSNRSRSLTFMKRLDLAQRGGKKKPSRKKSYWSLDYFFHEVVACLETAKTIEDASTRRGYLDAVAITWQISDQYRYLLDIGLKKPKETVLEIMVHKKLISDPSFFRNKVVPKLAPVKRENPYIRGCDPLVEKSLLDTIAQEPEVLQRYDVWRILDEFEFNPSLFRNKKAKHSISPPISVVRV